MKDRVTTLLGALAALVALLVLLGGGPAPEPDISRPTSVDRRHNGMAGLARWIRASGYEVVSLRHRLDWLLQPGHVPATGNLLVISLPGSRPYRSDERLALQQWVARGNTVLALNSLYRLPGWFEVDQPGNQSIADLLPLEFVDDADWLQREDYPAPSSRFVPALDHPVVSGVRRIVIAHHPGEQQDFFAPAVLDSDRPSILLLHGEGELREQALWLTTVGEGHVIASALPGLFSNAGLRDRDHARLAANIVAYGLRGGQVIFDDMHHGLSALYDPEAFFSDSRLFRTLGFLGVLWLVWLLGASNRFYVGDDHPSIRAPRQAGFVKATGHFLARSLGKATAARSLFRHFFADLRRSGRYRGDDQRLLHQLATDSRLSAESVNALDRYYHSLGSRKSNADLEQIHNLMQKVRKELR